MLMIFDCDGVLVDSEMIANRVLASHLSLHGYPLTAAECRERFIGWTIPGVIGHVRDAGVDLPDDFEATLRAKDVAAFERDLRPMSGVRQALEGLKAPRCVASSGSLDKIRTNLRLTGLLKYFESNLFSAAMVRHPKPAPDLFLFAAERMNARPEDCVVIEDSTLGVTAAARAGMRVLGFVGGGHCEAGHDEALRRAGAAAVFDDMRRLADLL